MIMVSVCMFTYNHEKFIRHALESVLMQKTSFDYEIIIGDDCSTDRTVSIIKGIQALYPDRIKLIARKKNIGMTGNSYDVKSRATGKYLAILEGDDYWTDVYKLQKQVDFLENNNKCIAVVHRVCIVNEREFPLGDIIPSIEKYNYYATKKDIMEYQALLLHPAGLLYRNFMKNHIEEYQFLEHNQKNFGGHKLLVFLLFKLGKIYISNEITAAYRLVKRQTAFNAVSLAMQNEFFSECGKLDCVLYMKRYLKNYDFSDMIGLEFASLVIYMSNNQILNKRNIFIKYFLKLTPKEIYYFLVNLFKKLYFN